MRFKIQTITHTRIRNTTREAADHIRNTTREARRIS
jgi:hypothetical protein